MSKTTFKNTSGYYQYPSLFRETLIFVAEGDLWQVPAQGGTAERRTCSLGALFEPHFSPNGEDIAFTGTQEGHPELYLMSAAGGPAKRLTFFDQAVYVIGWTPQGHIIFKSNHESAFRSVFFLYTLPPTGGLPQKLPVGPANFISLTPQGGCVIQRHGYGYLNWKRYRGGTAGELWIDPRGQGKFAKLIDLDSNNLSPLWIKDRIYFLSDHEGQGNIYSCTPEGKDITRHTQAQNFYVRQISRGTSPEDTRIVYKEGADLKILETQTGNIQEVKIHYPSSFPDKARVFANPLQNLTAGAISPEGQDLLLTTRGRLFSLKPFGGPVQQRGEKQGVRYRLGQWLSKTRTIAVKDKGLSEILEIFDDDPLASPHQIISKEWGRILELQPSPKENAVLLTNHRHELWHVDMKSEKATLLDKSDFGPFQGLDWSPDAQWAVYSIKISHGCSVLRLINLQTQEKTALTTPLAHDFAPRFDPQGRFIYFLSFRTFTPEKDALKFDWAFRDGDKPYLITLQKETTSPFILPKDHPEEGDVEPPPSNKKKKDTPAPPLKIDLEGISDRILPFPVPADAYRSLEAHGDKIFWLIACHDKEIKLPKEDAHPEGNEIQFYDLSTLKTETVVTDAKTFSLSRDGGWLMYVATDKKIRVIKAGEKPEEHDTSYRAGGWLNEERVRLEVDPPQEWRFMFEEAWRLQKDLFWRPDMGNVDWDGMLKRYLPLVNRVSTAAELMDVIGEMQGELGCSHAYTWGYPDGTGVDYTLGQLGATFTFNAKEDAWQINEIARGDLWDPENSSPLLKPGLNIQKGTLVWAIDGIPLTSSFSPAQALVHKAHHSVALTIKNPQEKIKQTVWVKPLSKITPIYYRDWVENNRRIVSEKTQGRVGYIHIPDMVEEGFAEFFRAYMQEFDKEGLILDVRFNNGGHIASLLLSVLSRKRLGFDQSRWDGQFPYLTESPRGPMVTLCNELTASDGDMFAYSFKALGMGPLIGKRTWGGVIGIFPKHSLLDGSMTSQPEYAIWFHDIGWSLENRGAEPDIDVDTPPEDVAQDKDNQLERGIQEILKKINEKDLS